MTSRQTFQLFYVMGDLMGAAIFAQLSLVLFPRQWWKGDSMLVSAAMMMLALAVLFLWLLLIDLGSLFDIPFLRALGHFPIRGMVVRAILVLPGAWLLWKFIR